MDSTFVKESMNIKWVSETGIVENMATVVKDFKETRGLLVSSCGCHNSFVILVRFVLYVTESIKWQIAGACQHACICNSISRCFDG